MDTQRLSGARVLVVDDIPDSLELAKVILELKGATVFTAPSVTAAFELLERETVDVLVTDLGMPGEDGYDLLRCVRRDRPEENGFIPAVALTGHAGAEDRERTIEAGFRAHVAKPVEPVELVRIVAEVVASSEQPVVRGTDASPPSEDG